MKKHLLTAMLAFLSATAMAQYSQETALDLVQGTNTCTLESEGETAYWKYTPGENTLITITPTSGYVQAYTIDDDSGSESTLQGVTNSSQQTIYYLDKGTTFYFRSSGNLTLSFDAAMQTGGNVGKGLSADDPAIITPGEDIFMGRSTFSSNGQTTYATYTATETGVLVLKSTGYAYISVNDGASNYLEYSSGSYVYNLSVEENQTYNLKFTQHYNPFILSSEMTHPQPGSLEIPFELEEGSNTVPADNGEYWYTFTNDKTGYGVISSDNSLSRGDVKIYNSKSNVQYGYVYAQSATGSYDVRFEMPSTGTTYYVCVNKVMGTGEDVTFDFNVENYAEGDKEDNPIIIEEMPATETTRNAEGTFYYAVNIPAGTHKFLNVEATTSITSTSTSVALYPTGNSWNATSGSSQVRMEVDGGQSGQQYIIRWTSAETAPITFTVSLEDIKQGDVITNPLEAKTGDNTIDSDGTKYYTYTATLTGKLVIKGTPEMVVTFPMGTGQYDGYYQSTVVGSTYTLGVTEGTQYYIKIENAKEGDVFTLSEAEYSIGESRDNPLVVENGTFTLGTDTYADFWLQYNVEKDGVLVIESDIPYNYTDQIMYCKSSDQYTSGLATTIQEGEDYTTIYKIEVAASTGDIYLVNLKLQSPYQGKVVTFNVRDAEEGETIYNPIILTPGHEISLPTPSRTKPVWCKATLDEGTAQIESNNSITGTYFEGLENAETGNGQYIYFSNYDENYQPLEYYMWTTEITNAGDYYFKFDQGSAGTILKLYGIGTSIENVDADNTCINVSEGSVSVSADGADVRIYSVSGAMVAGQKVTGQASFDLEPGIYIIKINDTVRKVAVR